MSLLKDDRMTGLFWNINRSDRRVVVAALCKEHAVDLLMLAECETRPEDLIAALADAGLPGFVYPPRPFGRDTSLKVFIRRSDAELEDVDDNPVNRFTIRRLVFDTASDVILAVAHLPSKLHASPADQLPYATALARSIVDEEDHFGHTRTVLVGDLNMHPFEAGVVNADGLHGVMTHGIAHRGGRRIRHQHRRFFYNPMWKLYGGGDGGPPGTFYRAGSGQTAYYWHMYDQVLVRPALVDALGPVRILDSVGDRSLLNASGRPDKRVGSDHLPLLFTLACG